MPNSEASVNVNTRRSPHSHLKPVPLGAVQLKDTFWSPRLETNRTVTIPSQFQHCEETGRIDNFRRASGRKGGDFQGIYFNDSDVYKWLEAAAYSLASHPDAELEAQVDGVIDEIGAAQEPNGYLNTYFTFERVGERWTNLRDMHELYCAGHLLQAVVAHHQATGKTTLLEIGVRLADHICDTFGPEGRPGTCGHEEIEMALVELYRETQNERYLKQAARFIDLRGQKPGLVGGDAYHQDHLPFREQSEMVGHAVRAVYLHCGASDVLAETGESALRTALDRLWENMTSRRMYITGGLGARYEGEAFGGDYELPNDRAYTETCAAIGSIMWNWRMLGLVGNSLYADLMELTLYNGMLAGLSLDGKSYFYQNPLADNGQHRRQPWFGCACCPPNVARLLASLPGYFYSVSEGGAWVHLYAAGDAELPIPGGDTFHLVQHTDYPWSGDIDLEIVSAPERELSLFLRNPSWCSGATAAVNGQAITDPPMESGYLKIARQWKAGDRVTLTLPMPVLVMEAHPYLTSNHGQVALCRGPLVYCIEAVDHPGIDIRNVRLPYGTQFTTGTVRIEGQAAVTLQAEAVCEEPLDWGDLPYRVRRTPSGDIPASTGKTVSLKAVPYYTWANRAAGAMRVWIPVTG